MAAALLLAACGVGDGDQIVSGPMPAAGATALAPSTTTTTVPPTTSTERVTSPLSVTSPLTLYVSNQSFDDPTVSITVLLDGETVVSDVFDVGRQHNWRRIDLSPAPGTHHLRAVSDTDVVFEATVEIVPDEPLWAVLDYWWAPPQMTFTFSEHDAPPVLG